jgi:hypothetical protein
MPPAAAATTQRTWPSEESEEEISARHIYLLISGIALLAFFLVGACAIWITCRENELFLFSFFAGGFVWPNAVPTSSNLGGYRLIGLSPLRFGFGFFGFTDLFQQCGSQFSREPFPSNALLVSEALALCLFNRNFHALSIANSAIVPTEFKLNRVAVVVFARDVMERTHSGTLERR